MKRDNEWETKLSKTAHDFRVHGLPAALMSMPRNPQDGIVLPLSYYLLNNALRVGDHWRTQEKHAYILCQWYDYLRLQSIGIFDAHEGDLRHFLLGGGTRYGNVHTLRDDVVVTLTQTNLVKLQAIVAFYDFWERVRGLRLRVYRGVTLARLNEEVFERRNRSISKAQINFSRSEASKPNKNSATPTMDEAEKILDTALDRSDDNRAQTWYLIGSLAIRSGSRAIGIHGFNVSHFFAGLAVEPAFKQLPRKVLKEHLEEKNRRLIVATLRKMKSSGRTYIFCDVLNKGGDWVPIAIPVELAIEIVDYICTAREDVIAKRFAPKNAVVPPNVFLSYKPKVRGGALLNESMSNTFNKIFDDLEIDGSLHRFRATFCQEVVREIYLRERAVHGRAWQVNNVLEFARKLLGHKNPHSLEHYLNNVLAQEILFGEPVMVTELSDVPLIRGICAALERTNADAIRTDLQAIAEKHGIEPLADDHRRYALF